MNKLSRMTFIFVWSLLNTILYGMEEVKALPLKLSLGRAVRDLDIPLIKQLLQQGANPNEVWNGVMTPLMRIAFQKTATDEQAEEIMHLLITHGAQVNHRTCHPLKWVCSARRAKLLIDHGCWINSEPQGKKNIFDAIARFEVEEFADSKVGDLFQALLVRGALHVPDWSAEERQRRVECALTMDRLIKKLKQYGSKDVVSRVLKYFPPSSDICSVTVLTELGNQITDDQLEFVCGDKPYSDYNKHHLHPRLSIAVLKRIIECVSIEKDILRKRIVSALTSYRVRIMKGWLNRQLDMVNYYPYQRRPSWIPENGPFKVTLISFISEEMRKKKIFEMVPYPAYDVLLGSDFFCGVREHYFKSLGVEVDRGDEICEAAKKGDLERVMKLHYLGISVNAKDSHNHTPLMMAVAFGHNDVCKWLMSWKADLKARDDRGWTALMYAVNSGNKEILKTTVLHFSRIHEKNNFGETAFMMAAFRDDLDIFKLLLEENMKYETDIFYSSCNAALARVAIFGKITVCKLIIDAMIKRMKRGDAGRAEQEKEKMFDRIAAIGHKRNRQVLEEYALEQFEGS